MHLQQNVKVIKPDSIPKIGHATHQLINLKRKISNSLLQNSQRNSESKRQGSSLMQDAKIEKLAQQLYPKFEVEGQNTKKRSSLNILIQEDANLQIVDNFTSQRRFQNKMVMNNAQRQLDKRLKNRVVQKANKLSYGIDSYTQIYRRLKLQKANSTEQQLDSPIELQQSERDGIKYYSQLMNHPKILEYTKERIQKKNGAKSLNHGRSTQIIKILSARKRKNVEQSKSKLQQQWAINFYNQQISNINEISHRLKKIYSSKNKVSINNEQLINIKNSQIIRHQHRILQTFSDSPQKISYINKQKLIDKFNQILNQFGRSSTSRRPELKLNKIGDRKVELERSVRVVGLNNRKNQIRSHIKNNNLLKVFPTATKAHKAKHQRFKTL